MSSSRDDADRFVDGTYTERTTPDVDAVRVKPAAMANRTVNAKNVPRRELYSGALGDGGLGDGSLVRVGRGCPDAPAPKLVVPRGYAVSDRGVARWEAKSKSTDGDPSAGYEFEEIPVLSCPVQVLGRVVDDAGVNHMVLAWRGATGWQQRVMVRSVLADARLIKQLADYGLPVRTDNAAGLVKFLGAYEEANLSELPAARGATAMGWADRETFIWGNKVISPRAIVEPDDKNPATWASAGWVRLKSTSEDGWVEGLRAEGEFRRWRDAIDRVKYLPRITLALLVSFAAPLLFRLGVRASSFVVDFHGTTSVGKTTTLRYAASIWGQPFMGPDSLVTSWSSTYTYLELTIGRRRHLPLFVDDTKDARGKTTVPALLSTIGNGRGRGRGTADAQVRQTGAWQTTCISTGEAPAVSFSEGGGERTRTMEVEGSPFDGLDVPVARGLIAEVEVALQSNFGHAGPLLVQHMMTIGDAELAEMYEEILSSLLANVKSSQETRMVRYRAVLELTLRLAERALSLPDDSDGRWTIPEPWTALWPSIVNDIDDAGGAARGLELVASWVDENPHKVADASSRTANAEQRDIIAWHHKEEGWVAFPTRALHERVLLEGFAYEGLMRDWRDSGVLLQHRLGKFSVQRSIHGRRRSVVVVDARRLWPDDDND